MEFLILSDKCSIEINEKYFEMCTFSSTKEVENIYTYVSGPKLFFGRGDSEFKHSPECCPLVQVATRYIYQNCSTTR